MNSPPSHQLPLNATLNVLYPEKENCTQSLPLPSPSPNQSSGLDIWQIPDPTMDPQLTIRGTISAVILPIWCVSQACEGAGERKDENSTACHHFHNFIEKIVQKYKTEQAGFYKDEALFVQYPQFRQRVTQEMLMAKCLNYVEVLQWIRLPFCLLQFRKLQTTQWVTVVPEGSVRRAKSP